MANGTIQFFLPHHKTVAFILWRLLRTFFGKLDFRRFQVNLAKTISLDDASEETLNQLVRYGDELADMVMKDRTDTEVMTGAYALPPAMRR